jgi:hypothetical protein
MVDTITLGTLHAIKDGMNDCDVKEKARQACSQLEMDTRCNCIANDFETFQRIFLELYKVAYQEKQERYKRNGTLHASEAANIASLGSKAYAHIRQHMEEVSRIAEGSM